MPLQLAKPLLHVLTAHAEAAHFVDATLAVLGQVLPHAPQLRTSVAVAASQPSPSMLLQLEKPVLHIAITHFPFTQAGVAFAREQRIPQAPQLFTSPPVSISQPSPGCLLQSVKPLLQPVTMQVE